MAQTGFTPIQLYSSSTTTSAPLAANLTNSTLGSELAINITDGKLFYKDNSSVVQVIAWKTTPTSAGGTGLTTYTAGDMVYYASGTILSKLGIGTADYVMTSSGSAPQWSQFLKATAGGTGQTSYAVGDILYASTTTALSKLADVATGNALISGGVGVAPSYGKIGLTTHVSGVLPVANGGTNASSASITAFNNITGYTASGATGTTSTNLVFSTSPTLTTPTLGAALATSIKFGSGTVLSNYEEGTWTPSLGGTTTYAAQVGRYTRIGRVVYFQCSLSITLIGTGSTTQISGLPFTSANNSAYGGHAIYYDGIDSNVSQIVGYIGTTNINLQSTTSFANSIGLYSIFKNGTNLTFQGFYFV